MNVTRALFLALPGITFLTGAAEAQGLTTLRVIGPPNDGYKAVFYGIRSGIFRRHGLEVQATTIGSGNAASAALIGGSVDVAFTNITAVIVAHTRGIPIQILAPGAWYDSSAPISAMLTLKDGPVRKASDLSGKSVGSLSLGDTVAASIQAWIDQNGGDAKSVRIIEVTAAAAVPMLEEGRVAAVTINEPGVSQALASGKVRVIANPQDTIAKRFETAALAVMTPYATQNFDVMHRFADAVHESLLFTNSHLAETVDLVSGYSGIAPEVVAHSVRMTDPEYVEARNIQPVIDILAKYGVTTRTFPAQELISPAALKPA
jgi:NitT/TauT family transport system substrate-binding protein